MISFTRFAGIFGPRMEFATLVHMIGRSCRQFLAVMNFPGDAAQQLDMSFHTTDNASLFFKGIYMFPLI